MKQETCRERWLEHKNNRIKKIKGLFKAYTEREDEEFLDYGLAFEFVAPNTFGASQKEGYWRYQISFGGPSEEFRFYSSGPQYPPHKITFVFLDWFDGYERRLFGRDLAFMNDIWGFFAETETTYYAQKEAMEG